MKRFSLFDMNSTNAHLYLPLVQALADGKTIQLNGAAWHDCKDTDFKWSPDLYRIKPWSLTRHLPGFRPLRDGEEWANPDGWEECWLKANRPMRPLLKGEEYNPSDCATWEKDHVSTFRPLPEPPKPVPLEPADWMKDGPWWIAPRMTKECAHLVTSVTPEGLVYDAGSMSHERAMDYERSNDGTTWTPCHKLP